MRRWIEHSRSPLIHGYWLKRYGIDGAYTKEAVRPEAVGQFLRLLAANGFVGCNVTVPHKEAAFAAADVKEKSAVAVAAANTLWLDDGTLRATNTDVEGFIANLDATVPGWDAGPGDAVVLGAGGAARAVVFGLIGRCIHRIHVVNRGYDRAVSLCRQFGPRVFPARWDEAGGLLGTARLLVNTTTLGMAGQPPLTIDLAPLPAAAVVAANTVRVGLPHGVHL